MSRAAELFAIVAIVVLVFGLLARFASSNTTVALRLANSIVMIPVGSICLVLATLLCFCASIYSLWFLPMSPKAAAWHFWMTSTGIVLFWISFFLLATVASGKPMLRRATPAAVIGEVVSLILVLVAQSIFVINFASAITKSPSFR